MYAIFAFIRTAALGAILLLISPATPATAAVDPGTAPVVIDVTSRQSQLTTAYGQLPLQFEANRGQTDERVRFLARGSGYALFLTSTEVVFRLQQGQPDAGNGPVAPGARMPQSMAEAIVRMEFVGADPLSRVEGLGKLPGTSNYFIGNDPDNWRTGIPDYSRVRVPYVTYEVASIAECKEVRK